MPTEKTFSTDCLRLTLKLPSWAVSELNQMPKFLPTLEERMAAVIRF